MMSQHLAVGGSEPLETDEATRVAVARTPGELFGAEHVAAVLARIRGMKDPVDRLSASRDLEAEILVALDEVRTVLAEAAASAHADAPKTLDERQQAPWD